VGFKIRRVHVGFIKAAFWPINDLVSSLSLLRCQRRCHPSLFVLSFSFFTNLFLSWGVKEGATPHSVSSLSLFLPISFSLGWDNTEWGVAPSLFRKHVL
jgi:predicted alpha/beta-fold hydrolase